MKKSDTVVWIEGAIAFLIPSLTTLSTSLVVDTMTYLKATSILCGAIVAGLSGLKSFLSTTFADNNRQPQTPATPADQPKQ